MEITLTIRPKTQIKYTFWCGPNHIPKDNQTIEIFQNKDIELIIPVRESGLNSSHIKNIENLLNHSIKVSFSLESNSFAHLRNYNEIIKTYKWLRNISFFNQIEEIFIDAEPEPNHLRKINQLEWYNALLYLVETLPTLSEIQNATNGYQTLIDMVHSDNKIIGIIKFPNGGSYLDAAFGNIQCLKLKWDKEIYMIYRKTDENHFYLNDYALYYSIKKCEGEIMIGALHLHSTDPTIDITISSHFNHERVYILSWGSFTHKYNTSFLENFTPFNSYQISYFVFEGVFQFSYFYFLTWLNIILGFFLIHP